MGAEHELAGRAVLVVGMGRTGISVARHLVAGGIAPRLCDRSASASVPADLAAGVEVWAGRDDPDVLDGIDLVIPSPGVPAAAPILDTAVRRGIEIISEIELAARVLPQPLVAITGTNGKSTTTSLAGAMLEQGGASVFVGGNLGTPLIEAAGGRFDVVVAEVSSFQLEWVDRLRPKVGAFLNLTDDHLDRHGDRENYGRVKARLFQNQSADDVAVLNRDSPEVIAATADVAASRVTFGSSPLPPADFGAEPDGAEVRIREPEGEFRLDLARTPLLGSHNRENIMAAALAARGVGARPAHIQEAIDGFSGLRHRMEQVGEQGGVVFIDDSKSTNVGALLKSLESLPDGRVVLIAGGRAKGGDFSVATELLGRKVRLAVLYGEARERLGDAWRTATELKVERDFADAVARAREGAAAGDIVLLSPACASMDQFRDYSARGNAFRECIGGG